MKRTLSALLLLPLWLGAVELVSGGVSRAEIILSASAQESEVYAAEELSGFILKMTGAGIPVVRQKTPGKLPVQLILVTDPSSPEAKKMQHDGFMIRASENGVAIYSCKGRGLLYGVYDILKSNGAVWFYPGKSGEYLPRRSKIIVEDGEIVRNPVFKNRTFRLNGNTALVHDTYAWLLRNGLQVTFMTGQKNRIIPELAKYDPVYESGGHEMSRLLAGGDKLSELFASHPEYFGIRNGKRTISGPIGADFCQPCTTEPEVIDRVCEQMRRDVDFYRGNDMVKVLLADDHRFWCECDRCKKLDPAGEAAKREVSTRWWTFVNNVAARLYASYPDGLSLNVYAYMNYMNPPSGVVPDPRVTLTLCPMRRCYRHSLDDVSCRFNYEYHRRFLQWHRAGLQITTFEYMTELPYVSSYLPLERVWLKDLQFYRSLNMAGFGFVTRAPDGFYPKHARNFRAYNMWRSLWQLHYITGFYSWYPEQAAAELVRVEKLFYGKAYGEVNKFRQHLFDALPCLKWGSDYSDLGKAGSDEFFAARSRELLRALYTVSGDPVAVERVKTECDLFSANWLKSRDLHARKNLDGIIYAPLLPGGKNADFEVVQRNISLLKPFAKHLPKVVLQTAHNLRRLYLRAEISPVDNMTFQAAEWAVDCPAVAGSYMLFRLNADGTFSCRTERPFANWKQRFPDPVARIRKEGDKFIAELFIDGAKISYSASPMRPWRVNFRRIYRDASGKEVVSGSGKSFDAPVEAWDEIVCLPTGK